MGMTPGAAGRYADTVYARSSPGNAAKLADGAGYAAVSSSGYSSNEERLVSKALWAVTDPGAASAIRNSGAVRELFPPRFTGQERTQPGISDVIQVDRRYPDSSAQFSGTSGGYSGSSVPSLGVW